ncbi:hypothetical protein V5H08_12440, partial [Vibrio cholerae]|uniref:hypothetical protein n=1 Tax=Vibrio cholerae TaxID=666 RepID=UPI003967DACD
ECDSKLTHYHPNWLNFNSDNYPARGGYPFTISNKIQMTTNPVPSPSRGGLGWGILVVADVKFAHS